jgi:ABC-type sugar transport system ATPase subunit
MSSVRIEALRKAYGHHVVVEGFQLAVAEGEFVALLGPSGCGKTTILRSIAGFEEPDGGSIRIGESVVADAARGIAVEPNKRNIGLVFQNYSLWPHMTVEANVAYPLRVRRVPRGERRARVEEALELVGLEGLGGRGAMELSGGQQQRVALARALVARPDVLLLDEPLSNLDAQRRARLRTELRRIHRDVCTTTVYVTHDQIEALTLADRVVVMNAGAIEQIGTPQEVFRTPANRFVAEFLGYENFLVVDGREATVRASAIALRDDERVTEPGDIALPATIVDVAYLGDHHDCALDAGDRRLVVRLPAGSPLAQELRPGDAVTAVVPAADLVFLDGAVAVPDAGSPELALIHERTP